MVSHNYAGVEAAVASPSPLTGVAYPLQDNDRWVEKPKEEEEGEQVAELVAA